VGETLDNVKAPDPDRMTRYESEAYHRGVASIAGIDEAGRGPLAGPVVASAVILHRNCRIEGLRDSKKLTASRRELLLEQIYRSSIGIGIGIVDQKKIDEINIYQATLLAMEEAVRSLNPQPELLLIDALRIPSCSIPQQPIIKGDDRSLSIAAASVVAKVTRDRLMEEYDRIYPVYQFKAHKGYGTKVHLQALRRHGPCEIHRRTFRGVVQRAEHGA
jgi:ribonuclease HII